MTEKDMRLTVGQLKKILKQYNVPDDALVCCYSDEEGNEEKTCCDVFVSRVGHKQVIKMANTSDSFEFVHGADVQGIDMSKDDGRMFITIRPLY